VIWHNVFLLELKTAVIVMSVLFVASFYKNGDVFSVLRIALNIIDGVKYSLFLAWKEIFTSLSVREWDIS
jgi:hypothetical protein